MAKHSFSKQRKNATIRLALKHEIRREGCAPVQTKNINSLVEQLWKCYDKK